MLPTIVTVNPFMAKHRKRRHNPLRHARRAHYRAHNRMRRHRRHHQRMPNPFSVRGLTSQLTPALIGAAGAVATDVAMAYLPLPTTLQSGWANILARAAVAIGVGYAAGMVADKRVGQEVGLGGLVVVGYSALKQALAPTLGTSIKGLSGLADFGDYTPAYSSYPIGSTYGMSGVGAYMRNPGMGAYMQPRLGSFGGAGMGAYMNPAAFVQASSPVAQRQRAMAGFGNYGGYDSDSM